MTTNNSTADAEGAGKQDRLIALADWLEHKAEYTWGDSFATNSKEAATLIRTAVNSHAALLAVCEAAEAWIEQEYRNRTLTVDSPVVKLASQLRTTIAGVKGKE